jgi:hypothetical protein
MMFTMSEHAETAVRARGIALEWIERVLASPTRIEADRDDCNATHALAVIPERGGRVLRVIYNHTTNPPHLVTVYFDRSMKGKL